MDRDNQAAADVEMVLDPTLLASGANNDNEAEASPQGAKAAAAEDGVMTGSSKTATTTGRRCRCFKFSGVSEAKGFSMLGVARGAIISSNVFLSSALIRLASEEAGCIFYDNDDERETPECSNTVYGFKPSSLITLIAVVTGLLSAFMMPVIGAVLDYTKHRRLTGALSAASLVLIQAAQIATLPATWFPMAILQAFAGFLYMVNVLAGYSYLPEIARVVGESKMTRYSSTFTILQFSSQAVFLMVVNGLSTGLSLNTVTTAHVSQAINVAWISVVFGIAWGKLLPHVQPLHSLPAGRSLVAAGFTQIVHTSRGIYSYYGRGLGFYLLATVFAEAGANAFTVVSVTFLVEVLNMSGSEVGIIFLVTLVATLPGAKLGGFVSGRTNPKISWILCLLTFSVVTVAGALVLSGPDRKMFAYLFGVLWGVELGWFYPTENLIFSLSLPKGQESELTGFFIYCTQILTWLPPLIFTTMNESGVSMQFGLMSLVAFFLIGVAFLLLMAPWDDVLEATKANKMISRYDDVDGISDDDGIENGDAAVVP